MSGTWFDLRTSRGSKSAQSSLLGFLPLFSASKATTYSAVCHAKSFSTSLYMSGLSVALRRLKYPILLFDPAGVPAVDRLSIDPLRLDEAATRFCFRLQFHTSQYYGCLQIFRSVDVSNHLPT